MKRETRNTVWVKICGTTNLEDAQAAVDAGADALGFVFAESPRRITPEAAAGIVRNLAGGIEKVGVFVNERAERISEIIRQVGLTAAQLHGDGTLDSEKRLAEQDFGGSLRVIHAASMYRIREMLEDGGVMIKVNQIKPGSALLLDSGAGGKWGGTGKLWDWEMNKELVAGLAGKVNIVVAGGLTPTNVSAAVAALHPWGVDVASGVESGPGKKDHEQVRAFVKAAKNW